MEPQTQTQSQPQRKWNPWLVASLAPLVFGPIWLLGGHFLLNLSAERWNTLTASVLFLACLVAAIDDYRRSKIANWITYPAFLWLFVISIACSLLPEKTKWLGTVGVGDMLAGSVVCFAIVLVPYVFGVGGGGDVKLATVIGAGLGLQYGLIAIGSAFVIAAAAAIGRSLLTDGPVAIFRVIYRRLGSLFSIFVLPPSEQDRKFLNQPLPMGPSFFCAVVLTLTNVIPDLIL